MTSPWATVERSALRVIAPPNLIPFLRAIIGPPVFSNLTLTIVPVSFGVVHAELAARPTPKGGLHPPTAPIAAKDSPLSNRVSTTPTAPTVPRRAVSPSVAMPLDVP